MYGINNTILSYGLTLDEDKTFAEVASDYKFNYLSCKNFTDILAIPAFLVIIRFGSLTDSQAKDFNECFQDTDIDILSLDTPSFEADFKYVFDELDALVLNAVNIIARKNYVKYSKEHTVKFLAYAHEIAQNDILLCSDPYCGEGFKEMADIIRYTADPEEIYIKLGKAKSSIESDFNNIYFREDCYDYLISQDLTNEEAFRISSFTRKGIYKKIAHEEFNDKLFDDFKNWALEVKYLPTREIIFSALAKEYNDYQTM